MRAVKDKREYEYPYIENADEKLKDLCTKGLDARYNGEKRDRAEARLNEELDIIRRQGSTSGYLTLWMIKHKRIAAFRRGYPLFLLCDICMTLSQYPL